MTAPQYPARPFIPWVGGKSALLTHLHAALPTDFDGFCEPFVGGGAMMFSLPHLQRRWIADANPYLTNAYHWIAHDVESVIDDLARITAPRSVSQYRDLVADTLNTPHGTLGAARFIATVKTSWGAKWEISAAGEHLGSWINKPVKLCHRAALRRCSEHLQGVSILTGDFREVLARTPLAAGDLVYLDPPYLPENEKSFTTYVPDGFTLEDHLVLAGWIHEQTARGVYVLLSMVDTDLARSIYTGLAFTSIQAPRRLKNRDAYGVDLIGRNY